MNRTARCDFRFQTGCEGWVFCASHRRADPTFFRRLRFTLARLNGIASLIYQFAAAAPTRKTTAELSGAARLFFRNSTPTLKKYCKDLRQEELAAQKLTGAASNADHRAEWRCIFAQRRYSARGPICRRAADGSEEACRRCGRFRYRYQTHFGTGSRVCRQWAMAPINAESYRQASAGRRRAHQETGLA